MPRVNKGYIIIIIIIFRNRGVNLVKVNKLGHWVRILKKNIKSGAGLEFSQATFTK